MFSNKKGFVGDLAFWLVFLFVFSVVAVIVFAVTSDIKEIVDADPSIVQESKNQVGNIVTPIPLWVDSVLAFLFLGSALLLFFSVFLIGDFPGLFFFIWFFLGIIIVLAAVLSNAYEEFILDSTIATANSSFSFLPWLMSIYPYALLFLGVTLTLGLFVKNRI